MKKLILFGIQEHKKTNSSDFFNELLNKEYEVKILDRNNYDAAIIKNADRVVFWQRPPNDEMIKTIPAEKIILVPMYDEARNYKRKTIHSWASYKIISFCRSMHEDLIEFGLNSIYLQYFPRPEIEKPISINNNKLFYWERESCYINEAINQKIVKKVLGKSKILLHIHSDKKDSDKTILKKYIQTKSSWFKDKSQMIKVLQECSLYMAPRESEGIGLSFLEAMANGLAVIGADNPTMNEYIKNGVNGYLYDLLSPKAINFTNLNLIREKSLETCSLGFEEWENSKWKIIEFINESSVVKKSVNVKRSLTYNSIKIKKPVFRLKRKIKQYLGI